MVGLCPRVAGSGDARGAARVRRRFFSLPLAARGMNFCAKDFPILFLPGMRTLV